MKRAAILKDAESMVLVRLLGIVAIVIGLGGSTALALDPLGPPLAGVEHGQFRAGADFSFSKTDLELTGGKWSGVDEDGIFDAGQALDFTLKDFETIKLYGTLGYGFAENLEAFVRFGAAKAEFGDSIWSAGEDFDSNIELAIGGGVRATVFEIPELNLLIGGVLQANWASFDGKLDSSAWPAPDFVEITLAEAQIAIGATYAWTDRMSVYAGPFVHYIRGDIDDIFADSKLSWDIDDGPIFGGYLGALFEIGDNGVLHVEYQQSSDGRAFSAGLAVKY